MNLLAYIHWNFDPQIIEGLPFRYYGFLFIGGIGIALLVLGRIFKRESIPEQHLEKLWIYGLLGVFLGARLVHCVFYDPQYYMAHPLEILLPIKENYLGSYTFIGYRGLASHGGLLGLAVAMLFYIKKTGQKLLKTVDLLSIVIPLGGVFIRLANLVNSEILGVETTVPWAFVFEKIDFIPRHPAQLYEAVVYLLIFVIVFTAYLKVKIKTGTGFYFGISCSLAFIARFLIEFIKERQAHGVSDGLLSMGQWLSIPYILFGVAFIFISLRNNKISTDNANQ